MNLKMLVRAFAKVAKKWDDSKRSVYCLSRYGYKNPRDWARSMSVCYSVNHLNVYADWIETPVSEWTQYEYDSFVEEEISCW